MQLVVADTGISIPGLLDPHSLSRKLLVVFAFGRLSAARFEAEEALEQARELIYQQDAEGPAELFEQGLQRRRERFEQAKRVVPTDTPDDLVLVTSDFMLQEFVEVATSKRLKLGPLSPEEALANRILLARMALIVLSQKTWGAVPDYTHGRDPNDDPVVHTAICGGAKAILSRDGDIVPKWKQPEHYAHPNSGDETYGFGLNRFIKKYVADFDLQSVSGQELKQLFALLSV